MNPNESFPQTPISEIKTLIRDLEEEIIDSRSELKYVPLYSEEREYYVSQIRLNKILIEELKAEIETREAVTEKKS